MGFRLGGSCSPCCQAPVSDPCLGSCRPAGETRPLTAINLTLTGANFTAAWEQIQPDTQYTVNYLWPGSRYSGTFSLTRTSATSQVYEYRFPKCGRTWVSGDYPYDAIVPCEVEPYLRYDARTDPVTLLPRCRLTMFLPGLLEPKNTSFFGLGRYIPSGSNNAPTCTDSTTVVVESREWNLKNCGTRSVQLMDGRVFIIDSTQSPQPTLPTVAVGAAVASDGVITAYHAAVGRGRIGIRSNLTQQVITPGTYKETGDPQLTLTNITTTYG